MSEVVSNWLVEENQGNPEKYFKSILETFIIVRKTEYARQNVRSPSSGVDLGRLWSTSVPEDAT